MNLVYTTDNDFCDKVGTSICSVFENNKDEDQICVYVLGLKITNENVNFFQILAERYDRTISVICVDEVGSFFPFSYDTSGWHPIVLLRLVLDKILPPNVKKVLYLDGDTIVVGSLHNLWKGSLRGRVLGGCIEATVNKQRKARLGLGATPYINAGVLLIDLQRWRDENWGDKILEYYQNNKELLFANDQDAINGAMRGRICYLPPKYNYCNTYWYYPYDYLKKLMGSVAYYSTEIYSESMKNPVIIHFLGEERPWRRGNTHKYAQEYLKYLNMTPWKDGTLETGWEIYFTVWSIFNFCVKPFPAIRYNVIDKLIPLFMRWRKHKRKDVESREQ